MVEEKNAVPEAENKEVETTTENKEEKAPEKVEDKNPEMDYKAELEKAKAILAHKEDIIKKEKQKNRELEEKEPEIDFEQLDERIKSAVESQVDGFKKSFVSDAISDEIDRLSSSPEEAELIRFHLEHSVKLSGTTKREVRETVEAAKLIANKKKIMSTNRELGEALRAKATTRTTADTAGEKAGIGNNEPNYTVEEKKILDSFSKAAENITKTAPASNIN